MPVQRSARPRPVLTGRAMVLGAVVVLLVVLLASPIHRYLASRGDVSSTAQQLREDRAALARLTKRKELYGDPGYLQQQARARLQYAMPGDTVYVVVDKGQRSDIEKTAGTSRGASDDTAWNQRLWDSVRTAAR